MHRLLPLALTILGGVAAGQLPAAANEESLPESVYAAWESGPPTDPDWFPIGVWLQDTKLAEAYGKLGVNTFVSLWKGPTVEQLADLKRAGMHVISPMNRVAMEAEAHSTIIGWIVADEPDNKAKNRAGPRKQPAEVAKAYDRLRARDPKRPVWLNLGQGVANDAWRGRAARRDQYPAYVQATDIVSFDVYPITNIRRDDGEEFLWYIARGVKRLRNCGPPEKIVWNFVECTRGSQTAKKPTPTQVESEVWLGLIHGSRGIVYFCHEFGERTTPAALLADREMVAGVTRINRRVLRYAPMLNSPTIEGAVELETLDDKVPVASMLKRHAGQSYLFCVGMRNRSVRARIQLKGASTGSVVEVLDEGRSIELVGGAFEDDFGPYEIHIYRISG